MEINDALALSTIIAIVFFVWSVATNGWLLKLITFIVSLGAVTIATTNIALDLGLVLAINAALFITIGFSALRNKKSVGNRILFVVLFGLGILLVILALNALGSGATGTIWTALVNSFTQGIKSFGEIFNMIFGRT